MARHHRRLSIHDKSGEVILANEADEVFTSDGALPLDYSDATIG